MSSFPSLTLSPYPFLSPPPLPPPPPAPPQSLFDAQLHSVRAGTERTLFAEHVSVHYVVKRYAALTASMLQLMAEYDSEDTGERGGGGAGLRESRGVSRDGGGSVKAGVCVCRGGWGGAQGTRVCVRGGGGMRDRWGVWMTGGAPVFVCV